MLTNAHCGNGARLPHRWLLSHRHCPGQWSWEGAESPARFSGFPSGRIRQRQPPRQHHLHGLLHFLSPQSGCSGWISQGSPRHCRGSMGPSVGSGAAHFLGHVPRLKECVSKKTLTRAHCHASSERMSPGFLNQLNHVESWVLFELKILKLITRSGALIHPSPGPPSPAYRLFWRSSSFCKSGTPRFCFHSPRF